VAQRVDAVGGGDALRGLGFVAERFAGSSPVWLQGEARIRRYGLPPAADGTQSLLQDLDVLDVHVPDGRREDGTFVGRHKGESPLLNSFTVREAGSTSQRFRSS
jgi:hypothetical protein